MRPFDTVILTTDLSANLPAGTEGTIVDTYALADDVYIVELFDRDGSTLQVVDVRADQMTVTLADFAPGERIALLADVPAHKLVRGQVGIIQERVAVGVYRVEFAGKAASLTLHAGQIMLLHWQLETA
ncbi:MAG: DUF4926 domain-containing protein [Anaerolineae bacterium]|jgi:hypothetical protein|nr:DUF4926 domain-containing protein [Anaerolineae bacterium]